MDAPELIGHLRQVPLFSRLSESQLERVAAIVQVETYPRGSRLATAGELGRAFHYILSGEALVRVPHIHGRLRPGGYLRARDWFGVTSLFLGEPHDTTVEAKTDVMALVLYRSDLQRLLRQAPELEDRLALPQEVSVKLHHEHFDWLGPAEVVVFLARRHWFIFVRAMLLPTLVLLILSVLLTAALRDQPAIWWAIIFALLSLAYGLAILWHLVDWRNDYFVVTTQRIVHRELVLFLYEARYEAPLNQVQDVVVKRTRLGNILGYGNAIIQTATRSGIGPLLFDHLPNPDEAKRVIFQQTFRAQARTRETEGESVRTELQRRLQWVSPEELAAQGQTRDLSHEGASDQLQPKRPQRSFRVPFLAPLREQTERSITWRKHWVFLVHRVLLWFLAALTLLVFLTAYILGRVPFLPPASLGGVLGLLVLFGIASFGLWWQVADWENDIYIVTEDRLIDIEKKPLFGAEERRETTLDRVQNVNLVIPGPIATLLNYGDVNIDTAGGEGQFTFTRVMGPHDVQREIMSRVNLLREQRRLVEAQQRRREMADWFAIYEKLRREHENAPRQAEPDEAPEEPEQEG